MPTVKEADTPPNKPPPIGKDDHLQPFTASSNVTTILRPQSKFNKHPNKGYLMHRNKAIGGGKLGKSTRGWGTLPTNIIHIILNQVIKDAELPWPMIDAYVHNDGAAEIAEMIAKRRALCKLRLVARGWKNGVDSHSYWPHYTLILDPSKGHTSTVADLRSSRTTPSTPSYPSLFHRARSLTLEVCLPCRLNQPNRLGLYPAHPKALTHSNHLGFIPTCLKHMNIYCSCCLRAENAGYHNPDDEVILHSRPRDLDDKGRYYNNPIVCGECREGTLKIHIEKELVDCARGGIISGRASPIIDNFSAQEYLLYGQYNVIDSARFAIRESWIINQTVYTFLESILVDLQRCENQIKREFIFERHWESPELKAKRIELIQKLFDESIHNLGEFIPRIVQDVNDQYAEWAEEDDIEFENDDDLQLVDIRQFWIETGQEAACYRWVRDRIRSGYWVFPSDELDAMIDPSRSLITPRHEIIASADLPLGILQTTSRPYNPMTLHHDLITPTMRESHLPPHSIVENLDEMFRKMMMKLLYRPCKDKVMGHVSSGYEVHQLEATRMSTSQMLEYLRTEDAWGHLLPYRPPVSFPISRPVWGRRKVSPEIEAVPLSDEEGGDGFIVEVEEEDEDGESSLEEEERMVSVKESSEEPIVTSTLLENTTDVLDSSALLETTTDVLEPTSTSNSTDDYSEPTESISTDEQDEEAGLNGNRKRKSPPLPITRATKRRSSDEHHPTDIPDSNSNGDSNLPKRNLSEESFTSSDTQPLTPPLREIELRRIQRERAEKEPRIARSEVPHIPAPGVHLGRGTEELLRSVYEVALDPFVCCRCGVCMRRWR